MSESNQRITNKLSRRVQLTILSVLAIGLLGLYLLVVSPGRLLSTYTLPGDSNGNGMRFKYLKELNANKKATKTRVDFITSEKFSAATPDINKKIIAASISPLNGDNTYLNHIDELFKSKDGYEYTYLAYTYFWSTIQNTASTYGYKKPPPNFEILDTKLDSLKPFTNKNITAHAWKLDFTMRSRRGADEPFYGTMIYAGGKKSIYTLLVQEKDPYWQKDKDNVAKILDSLKIDQ